MLRGFAVLLVFFEGVWRKAVCSGWFFVVKVVVNCVVNVVRCRSLFGVRKTGQVLQLYFRVRLGKRAGVESRGTWWM